MKDLRTKAIDAFKKKYGELPADAGFPVVRERLDAVYFARNVEDWHEYAKIQKFFGRLVVFVIAAIFSIVAIVGVDLVFVRNHQLLLFALAAYAILLVIVGFVTACRCPKKTVTVSNREMLFYDALKDKIYVVAL